MNAVSNVRKKDNSTKCLNSLWNWFKRWRIGSILLVLASLFSIIVSVLAYLASKEAYRYSHSTQERSYRNQCIDQLAIYPDEFKQVIRDYITSLGVYVTRPEFKNMMDLQDSDRVGTGQLHRMRNYLLKYQCNDKASGLLENAINLIEDSTQESLRSKNLKEYLIEPIYTRLYKMSEKDFIEMCCPPAVIE